jgi:hypothetical protein
MLNQLFLFDVDFTNPKMDASSKTFSKDFPASKINAKSYFSSNLILNPPTSRHKVIF